jgi:hypothetical protein
MKVTQVTTHESRLIVFNVPQDITSKNAAQAIHLQNSKLNLNQNE